MYRGLRGGVQVLLSRQIKAAVSIPFSRFQDFFGLQDVALKVIDPGSVPVRMFEKVLLADKCAWSNNYCKE